jgi:cell division protein FtsZ
MIQLNRNYNLPDKAAEDEIPLKVVGVGGAGLNVLDRIVLDGMTKANIIAINTDVQSLASSVAAHKVQLGRTITRGLGTGGDPDLGHEAAYESVGEIQKALADTRMIFVCTGLGGGTGSGAAPAVAQIARESGASVVVFATLPFTFEGKRRMAQAQEALAQLREDSDAVICFENDRMGDMVAPKAGIHQAFAVADVTISQSVRSIVNLIQRPGLIQIGLDDLLSALRSPSGRCLFGFGESDSDNRAHDALTRALKNPLMDRGRMLANASHVLVHVAGGPAMTLSEVEILMHELGRHINDHTQILFGTSVDGRMGNRLSVTLISSPATEEQVAPAAAKPARCPKPEPISNHEPVAPPISEPRNEPPAAAEEAPAFADEFPQTEEPAVDGEVKPAPAAHVSEEPVIEEAPPPPRVIFPKKRPAPVKEPKPVEEKKVHAKQEVLQFEPVTRGRFEKSEPTIVEGQDLDIPTFLRKHVRVK